MLTLSNHQPDILVNVSRASLHLARQPFVVQASCYCSSTEIRQLKLQVSADGGAEPAGVGDGAGAAGSARRAGPPDGLPAGADGARSTLAGQGRDSVAILNTLF